MGVEIFGPIDICKIRQKVKAINGGNLCDLTIEMAGHQNTTFDLCSKLTRDDGKVLLEGLTFWVASK